VFEVNVARIRNVDVFQQIAHEAGWPRQDLLS
jgi:hypothetical protein